MLDSNIRGLFKRVEYQIANLKGLFSKSEKQMLDNVNEFKKDNEEFKDSQKYVLTVHMDNKNNPHNVTKDQIGLDEVDNVKQASEVEFLAHKNDTELHVTAAKQKSWDAKETTSGSQSKAEAALVAAKKYTDEHANNKEIHVLQSDKDKWNNGQLFKLTQNNGKPIYKGVAETTDYNEIIDTGFYLIFNKGLNAPPSVSSSFMIVISYGNILMQTAYDTNGRKSYYRIKKTDSTWTAWQSSLTEEDKISQSEKDKWNNGQLSKITADNGMPLISIKDTSLSILDEVINNGLGHGTFYAIAGSRDMPNHRSCRGFYHMTDTTNGKASFGWVYATDYANNIYTNYLNNNVWSGWARLSNPTMFSETGQSQLLANGTDILTLPSGYYYAVGTNVVNMPSKTDSSWFNIYVVDNSNNRKTFHIIRSGDNLHWWGTVHTDGSFKGWKRMMTVEDFENSTYVDTYDQENSSVLAAENVATKLNFGVTRADDLSEYNRTRSEITLKNNGLYLIRLYITSDNITVGSDNILSCYVNGAEYQRLGNWSPNNPSSTCVLFLQQKFKAGDKVTFYITPKNTGKTIAVATCYVTMSQIR